MTWETSSSPACTACWGSSTKPLCTTSHRERKSAAASSVKSGASFDSSFLICATPSVFISTTERSLDDDGGLLADAAKSAVGRLRSRGSPFMDAFMNAPELGSQQWEP